MFAKIAYIGGPDLSLRIPLMKILQSEGYEVFGLGSCIREKDKFEENGIAYIYYPLKQRFGILSEIISFMKLYLICRKERFDAVHAFDTKPTILGRIAASMAGVQVIVGTIPGLGTLFSEENVKSWILRYIYLSGQKLACGVSKITIFQNSDDHEYFLSRGIADSSNAAIIRGSGVDIEKFSCSNHNYSQAFREARPEFGSSLDGVKIFMISRVMQHKGVNEYLEAAKTIKQKYGHVHFYLVGPIDNARNTALMRKMETYKKYVSYLGPRNDIPALLCLSDIVVLPSYLREGVPRVLLEAASMQRPIITTNMPGCKDVVDNNVTGYIIPPRDPAALAEALEKLISDKKLRESMGEKARQKIVESFSLGRVSQETLMIYQRFLGAREERN